MMLIFVCLLYTSTAMEQHTKKHARQSFYHLKNALGGLKIAMRGAFLNIKSMLALQIIYSIFYTLIEYSLFQLLLSIALKIDGYSFLNSANIGRFLITPPAIAMLLILFLTACMLTYLNACILLGGFQASLARQKLRMKDIFLHGLSLIHIFYQKRTAYCQQNRIRNILCKRNECISKHMSNHDAL